MLTRGKHGVGGMPHSTKLHRSDWFPNKKPRPCECEPVRTEASCQSREGMEMENHPAARLAHLPKTRSPGRAS